MRSIASFYLILVCWRTRRICAGITKINIFRNIARFCWLNMSPENPELSRLCEKQRQSKYAGKFRT